MEKRVDDLYFAWLVSLIDDGDTDDFSKLLRYLYSREFTWSIDFDSNRAAHGLALRDRFIYENNYSEKRYGERMKIYMPDKPCSVLEMMIGLSISCENVVGSAIDWFWFMIKNLGLMNCRNYPFDESYVKECIDRFLNREYRPDGKGGLFYIKDSRNDLRQIEIWYQFQFYVNSVYDHI